jgi:hypothetical protein
MFRIPILVAAVLAWSCLAAGAVELDFNGFASVVAARVIAGSGGNPDFPRDRQTPAMVADYNTGALYEDGVTALNRESRLGAQLNLRFSDSFSLVSQAVARAYPENVKLEWLYLSWDPLPNWTLQVGRKRIPIYFYSEFQDVGVAYTWARPPQALYGWEASNYNGGSLRYTGAVGAVNLRASVYGGEEEVADAGYNTIYYEDDQDSRWENILGADCELSYDWLVARVVYLTSENRITSRPDSDDFSSPPMEQSILGLALNGDFGAWFVVSEFNLNTRDFQGDGYEIEAPAILVGAGHRCGAFTPFVSWSRYWETTEADLDTYAPERFVDASFTLRYDVNPSLAVKAQFDRVRDESLSDFVGDTSVFTLATDVVF